MLFGVALALVLAVLVAVARPARAAMWLAAIAVSALAIPLWFPMVLVTAVLATLAVVDVVACTVRSKPPLVLLAPAPFLFAVVAGGVMFLVHTYGVEAHHVHWSDMEPTLEVGDDVIIDKLHHRSPAAGDLIAFRHPRHPCETKVSRVIALAGETVEVRCDMVYVNGKRLPSTLDAAHATYRDPWGLHGTDTQQASRYHEWLGDHDYDVFHDAGRPERDRRLNSGARVGAGRNDFPSLTNTPWSCVEDKLTGPIQRALCTIVDGPPVDDVCAPHRHYVVPPGHVFVLGDNRSGGDDSRRWGSLPIANIEGYVTGIWLSSGPDGIRWRRPGVVE